MSNKFVIKCGNFAVLVDLHALPLGVQEDTSWSSQELKEEVSALIREAVDQRVKQFLESRWQQQKGPQAKYMKEMTPANPLCIKGPAFRLAAYFMKRHVNLRCISKQHYRELRVFPERFVVCVSRPEHAAAATLSGNVTRSMEQGGQSRSEYFSGRSETLDPLNSSAITKRTALQKIAKQASAQAEASHSDPPGQGCGKPEAPGPCGSSPEAERRGGVLPPLCPQEVGGYGALSEIPGGAPSSGGASLEGGEGEALAPLSLSKPRNERSRTTSQEVAANPQQQERSSTTRAPPPAQPCVGADDDDDNNNNNNNCSRSRKRPSRLQGGLFTHDAKRLCLGGPSEPTAEVQQPDSSERASPRSSVLGPCPRPPPPPLLEHAGESLTLEAELAAHGKQAGRLPLRVSNTEQTNPSRLATSLRGLSVKPQSSGSSISSRPAAKEEGRQSAARTSRLRRPRKS
ncbi:protein SLX4IP isoform X2 [Clupea harengus]|uniref:Protein SLX4IP isoform X2 n=1 Tax=Clupea harengus TaxID=7950 RepID=A0A6P8GCC8_CLUHA|nr:protein SLX4IP isoform X2 [Clupea harengus]